SGFLYGDFVEFERERYSGMAESVPEFSLVVDFLDSIENGNQSAMSVNGFKGYKDSYVFFTNGDLSLLDAQTVVQPFSRMWLYPYQTSVPEFKYRAVLSSIDYLLKCVDAFDNSDVLGDEELAVVLQEAGNSL